MNKPEDTTIQFSPFWPMFLMAMSLVVFLGWRMTAAVQHYVFLVRVGDQQAVQETALSQSAPKKQEPVVMDLLELSKTDPDAKAIVGKYGFAASQPAASAVPAP